MRAIKIALISIFAINSFAATIKAYDSKSLHLALKEACSNNEDDTIELEDGSYNTSDSNLGTFKYIGIDGKNLKIKSKSNNYNSVTLNGNGVHKVLHLESNKSILFEIEGISITNGYSDTNGGGVYTNQPLIIKNSFIYSNKTSKSGGAIYGSNVEVYNSTISSNYAGYGAYQESNNSGGGGVFANKVVIQNSTFSQNRSDYGSGGAIRAVEIASINAKYLSNIASSNGNGGAIHTKSLLALNNLFYQNSANLNGGAIFSTKSVLINSNLIQNSASNGYGIYSRGVFINNYFDNVTSDIYLTGTSILKNNYLDYPKIVNLENNGSQTIYMSNNIQKKSSDNFLDTGFNIIDKNASIIDSGLNYDTDEFKSIINQELNSSYQGYLNENIYTDLAGNMRVSGKTVDIGVFEYNSTRYSFEPTINYLNYEGILKSGESITFSFLATPFKGREIAYYEFDYGDGIFVRLDSNTTQKTYTNEGNYTIRLKATDNLGSFSIKSVTLNIIRACEVCPKCETIDTSIYDINQSEIDSLPSGWHLLGTSKEIDIKTKLPNADKIWLYLDNKWLVYEKNSSNPQISTIPAKKGFWYKK